MIWQLLNFARRSSFCIDIVEIPIQAKWIESDEIINMFVPHVDSIMGDKLTAFAPNTTGIKYGADKELEFIKKHFDTGDLFEKVDSPSRRWRKALTRLSLQKSAVAV